MTQKEQSTDVEASLERSLELEAWCQDVRIGLYDVRERLQTVRTSAIMGHLPGVSGWIFDVTCEISHILGWLGTPVANTNSNSNSEEQGSPRITNSSSKERERESTNTKYEEQAP